MFDTFQAMDRRHVGSIRRADYVWALTELGPSIEFQKTATRVKLSTYFHETARELCFEDFLGRAFPTASPLDIARMLRWATLRKAHNILMNEDRPLSDGELQEAFLLLEDELGGVLATELLRARIVSREEMFALLSPAEVASSLSFESFRKIARGKFWQPKDTGSSWRAADRLTSQLSSALISDEPPLSPAGGQVSTPSARLAGQPDATQRFAGTPIPLPPTKPPESPQRPRGFQRSLTMTSQHAAGSSGSEMVSTCVDEGG